MATARLVIDREGRMVLAVDVPLSKDAAIGIRRAFDEWRRAQPPQLLIVPDAEVVRVVDVELGDLTEAGA